MRGVSHFISTSLALADSTSEAFQRRFGREIVQYYGSAESARSRKLVSAKIWRIETLCSPLLS